MKELFVPIELARKLKAAGYVEPALACYDGSDMLSTYSGIFEPKNYNIGGGTQTSAPLYQQVVDWFRKVHKIIIVIDFYNNGDEWCDTTYDIRISEFKHFKTHDSFVGGESKSYYDVFNTAIEEALKLI